MSNIILPPGWKIHESRATPEAVFQNRREFLKMMGFAGTGVAGALYAGPAWAQSSLWNRLFGEDKKLDKNFKSLPDLKRNPEFTYRRAMTHEDAALKYNNFYEFTSTKEGVWTMIDKFKPRPWEIEISGLVENPMKLDVDELIELMPAEERVYRHRCVETWAMVVPWAGFPLKTLIDKVRPKNKARYLRFTSFNDPEAAPGQRNTRQPWPYTEGLTMDEAQNELSFIVTGVYGHQLPKQHGAPLRLAVPWKYGYKSIKSIVGIEFTDRQPETFWNALIPHEYPFESNVDPDVPHPRWSQRREKMIGTGEIFATQKFNGYGDWVADLYS